MNILIISDDPERRSFCQILDLKQRIQELGGKVDMFVFSKNGIFLNGKKVQKRSVPPIGLLENILKKKEYATIVISVTLNSMKYLFPGERNILRSIPRISLGTDMFVFGAPSMLDRIEKDEATDLFFHPRHGVAKLTREFTNDLVAHIKKKELDASKSPNSLRKSK
jgi:hypothetical protein